MQLNRQHWTKQDGELFQNLLVSYGKEDRQEWTKKIINTNMPVLAIPSSVCKDLAKQIGEGNFLEFLDLKLWDYYESTTINGTLICKIKDFETMVAYLDWYVEKADNWATCDLLSFAVNQGNKGRYYDLALKYISSIKPFVRRCGINVFFKLIKFKEYLSKAFNMLNSLGGDDDYYVNMVCAWLVAECFIQYRDETLEFFKQNKLNRFTHNKAIQKCRDSFRVSRADKDLLLTLKKKHSKFF